MSKNIVSEIAEVIVKGNSGILGVLHIPDFNVCVVCSSGRVEFFNLSPMTGLERKPSHSFYIRELGIDHEIHSPILFSRDLVLVCSNDYSVRGYRLSNVDNFPVSEVMKIVLEDYTQKQLSDEFCLAVTYTKKLTILDIPQKKVHRYLQCTGEFDNGYPTIGAVVSQKYEDCFYISKQDGNCATLLLDFQKDEILREFDSHKMVDNVDGPDRCVHAYALEVFNHESKEILIVGALDRPPLLYFYDSDDGQVLKTCKCKRDIFRISRKGNFLFVGENRGLEIFHFDYSLNYINSMDIVRKNTLEIDNKLLISRVNDISFIEARKGEIRIAYCTSVSYPAFFVSRMSCPAFDFSSVEDIDEDERVKYLNNFLNFKVGDGIVCSKVFLCL